MGGAWPHGRIYVFNRSRSGRNNRYDQLGLILTYRAGKLPSPEECPPKFPQELEKSFPSQPSWQVPKLPNNENSSGRPLPNPLRGRSSRIVAPRRPYPVNLVGLLPAPQKGRPIEVGSPPRSPRGECRPSAYRWHLVCASKQRSCEKGRPSHPPLLLP